MEPGILSQFLLKPQDLNLNLSLFREISQIFVFREIFAQHSSIKMEDRVKHYEI